MRAFLSTVLFLSCAAPSFAGGFEDANSRYAAGDYTGAVEAYEKLIAADGATASRLYNLGSAHFRLKQYGPAILAFERAIRLAPRDPDIREALKTARESGAVVEDNNSEAWWMSAARMGTLHEWSWVTIIGSFLTGAAVLAGGLRGISRPGLRRFVLGGSLTGVILAAAGGMSLWLRRGETSLAIITSADSTLKLSPFAESGPAGSAGSGRTVVMGERHDDWVRVTVAGAELSGWIPAKNVSLITPSGS